MRPSVPHNNWVIAHGGGPVLATAIHAGHDMSADLAAYMAVDAEGRRREEDPLTDRLAILGENSFCNYNSRFEVDLNRSRERALSTRPEDTWGNVMWSEDPPSAMVERSLGLHDRFYELMRTWLERLIATHGAVLLLDVHSYNHRRKGPRGAAAPAADNPDIDLGLTTLDPRRFGLVAERFAEALRACPVDGHAPDVRGNVRYPDGGHFPEWVFANYGDRVCTITLEYKKIYIDEWTSVVSLPVLDELRAGLRQAIQVASEELQQVRQTAFEGVVVSL